MALRAAGCLNAPFGARCFLTTEEALNEPGKPTRLNAPFGARCFLTDWEHKALPGYHPDVLMHLLALGAF